MNRMRGEKGEEVGVPQDLQDWGAKELNETASIYGERFANMDTSQIRNVFSEVKRLQLEWKKDKNYEVVERSLILLKPKLAYAAGKKGFISPFKELLEKAIDGVINSSDNEKALKNFFDFVEAIVAYHKYYHERSQHRR